PWVSSSAEGGWATERCSASQTTEANFERPVLVHSLTPERRAAVVDLDPRYLGRTFTLRGLARLAANLPRTDVEEIRTAATPRARLVRLVEKAHAARATAAVEARDPASDDIEDPIGRPANVYAEVYQQIKQAVATIARVLG